MEVGWAVGAGLEVHRAVGAGLEVRWAVGAGLEVRRAVGTGRFWPHVCARVKRRKLCSAIGLAGSNVLVEASQTSCCMAAATGLAARQCSVPGSMSSGSVLVPMVVEFLLAASGC